jgi:16S rRNA G966 N2-methylase RsmD
MCIYWEHYLRRNIIPKTRLNISLDQDLVGFVKVYVQENQTTVADVVTQFIVSLKRQTQGDSMEIILSDPDFHKALLDVQSRLRNGTAKWHTFEEVFGD